MSDGAPTQSSDTQGAGPQRTAGTPAPTPTAAPPPRYDDEISLRELYLILRRGLPLILLVTVIAAVGAFAFVALQPDVYEAEATVVSSPTTVQVEEQGALAFSPRSAVTFETYEDIAISRATFEAALAALEDAGTDAPESFRELRSAASVERLSGPSGSNASTPLTVTHRVSWTDPVLAARYADAWALATVEQVRATLLADLEPTRQQALQAIEAREADLLEAESAFEVFAAKDLDGVEQRLETARSGEARMSNQLQALDLEIARLAGQVAALADAVGPTADVPLSADALSLLADTGRMDASTAARLATSQPSGILDPTIVTALLARTDLQQRSVQLAGALDEESTLRREQEAISLRIDELRARKATLEAEERVVIRRLNAATSAYEALRALEPALAFVADLTPSNTRVLNAAQEPVEPSGTSARLVAALAAVVAFLAATLFVFLREAVRAPANETA